jgi:hypothetical protein
VKKSQKAEGKLQEWKALPAGSQIGFLQRLTSALPDLGNLTSSDPPVDASSSPD